MDFIVMDLSTPCHMAKTNVKHGSLPSPACVRLTETLSAYCVCTDLSCKRTEAAECPITGERSWKMWAACVDWSAEC